MAKVVVVDDMEAMCLLLSDLLSSWGHQVLAFDDAAPALAEVDFTGVDMVITDLKMPTDGRTLIRRLREQGLDVPIVVISGCFSECEYKELIAMGVQAVMRKPPDFGKLKSLVHRFLVPCAM